MKLYTKKVGIPTPLFRGYRHQDRQNPLSQNQHGIILEVLLAMLPRAAVGGCRLRRFAPQDGQPAQRRQKYDNKMLRSIIAKSETVVSLLPGQQLKAKTTTKATTWGESPPTPP